MEKININNYEAYVLDYLEGNLGAEETHDLMIFLDQHPELKKDLNLDLNEVSLKPVHAVFENKEVLKVTEDAALSMTTVDTWMIESVEKNLTASKQQELDDFVRRHQLEKTYIAYQATILKADLNEVFENKKALKVSTGIVIPMYLRVAAVAAVAVFIIGVALNTGDSKTETAGTSADNGKMVASKTEATDWLRKTMDQQDSLSNPFDLTGPQNQVIQQMIRRDKTPQQPQDFFVQDDQKKNEQPDTSKAPFDGTFEQPNIADQHQRDNEQQPLTDQNDDVAVQTNTVRDHGMIVTEQPYKIVTDAASSVTKKEVYFTRDRNTETNEYVAYGFKIGAFEFERKK